MQTLTDIIVVEQDPLPCKSKEGLILLPQYDINEESGVYTGTVKVSGPDCKTLKPGSRVMFHRSTCAEMEYENRPFRVLHEHEVLAEIED